VIVELLANRRRSRQVWKGLENSHQGPRRVDRGMPIITPVKRAGGFIVRDGRVRRFPDVRDSVRAWLGVIHARQRHCRHLQRRRFVQRVRRDDRQRCVEGREIAEHRIAF